jgi:hypothetical protein
MKSLLKVDDARIHDMQAGAQELERWLLDLLRQGLVVLDQEGEDFWEEIAGRMVNAKLGDLGRRIRSLKQAPEQEARWEEKVLKEISYLYLITRGLLQLNKQKEEQQCELLRICGVRIDKKALLQSKGTTDTWLIISQEFGKDEQLHYRRIWLYGENSHELALLLDFSWGSANFFPEYTFGGLYKGEIIYYPGATPQRALFKEPVPFKGTFKGKGGFKTLRQLALFFAKALQQNPWLKTYPCLLNQIRVVRENHTFLIMDPSQQGVPLTQRPDGYWKLLALTADQPLSIFGLWNGEHFQPKSVFAQNRLIEI